MQKKRSRLSVLMMSVLNPGLGFIYIGRPFAGLIVFSMTALWLLLAGSWAKTSAWAYLTFVWFIVILFTGSLIYTVLKTPKTPIQLRPYHKSWIYISFYIVTSLIYLGVESISKWPKSFQIPASSMIPTLLIGDNIVVDKQAYSRNQPHYGDLIVFKYPKDENLSYIKRVVGLPGDTLEMHDHVLFINRERIVQNPVLDPAASKIFKDIDNPKFNESSQSLYEEHIGQRTYIIMRGKENLFSGGFDPIQVPKGRFFVLGDNRDYSNDSRFWGFVPEENVTGKALFISFQKFISFQDRIFKLSFARTGITF